MDYNHRATDTVSPASAGHALGEYRNLLRRRRVYPATIIPASVLGAVFIAFYLPVSYRATGTIMLQPSEIPAEMVSSTVRRTARDDVSAEQAQQEVELLRRRVMTPEKLQQLVQEIDPYPADKRASLEAKAQRVAADTSVERVDPITLKPLNESTAFSIHYDNPKPLIAAAVAEKLVDLYLTYNRRTRAEQATAAYEFLQNQAKEVEGSMVAQEQKLARFKTTYGNSLPDRQQHNLLEIDRLQRDLQETQRELVVAEEKQSELQLQLNSLSPSMTASVSDWRTQLAKLRSDLAAAEEKYTPEHPEIKRLKRAIDEMVTKGSASLRQNGHAPDNPDYLAVQSQLRAAQRSVATLRSAEARERHDIEAYEAGLLTEPNVEREYTQLQRDYENARLRYEDIQAKMKNAALARTMEQEERGERFTLLQAPVAPKKPYSPNRLGIILLGVVLGFGVALGCVTAVDAADPTVRGTTDLQEITGGPAIGAIPVLLSPADLQGRKLRWSSGLVLFAFAIVVALALVLVR
jgi:polysaccharide chain length determinant protein (PEP-CTERM system associated)